MRVALSLDRLGKTAIRQVVCISGGTSRSRLPGSILLLERPGNIAAMALSSDHPLKGGQPSMSSEFSLGCNVVTAEGNRTGL